jgi:hypothetical protein
LHALCEPVNAGEQAESMHIEPLKRDKHLVLNLTNYWNLKLEYMVAEFRRLGDGSKILHDSTLAN